MSEFLSGSALENASVTEAKLETAFTNKVTNAYATANLAYAKANTGISSTENATITNNFTFAKKVIMNSTSQISDVIEKVNVSSNGLGSTLNFDVLNQPILYLTGPSTANCALNFRGNSTVTLSGYLQANQSVTVSLFVNHTSAGYVVSNVSIDSISQTVRWASASPPIGTVFPGTDLYTFNIINTASGYLVFGSTQRYA